MSKRAGVLAIACWCFAAAAAEAQYGPVLNGQPAMVNPAVPPSADYYNSYNAYQSRLAANPGVAPGIVVPANRGWTANGANPGSPTATGFPYSVNRANTAVPQGNRDVPPSFPEQTPEDVLTSTRTEPNFDDPASTTVIGPENSVPSANIARQNPNLNPQELGGNAGTQGANYGSGSFGGCSTGNCGTSCAPCCPQSCCAGRMGPGPLFYSGTYCSCLTVMKTCLNGGGFGGWSSCFGGMGGGGQGAGAGCGANGCGSPFQQSVGGSGGFGGYGGLPVIGGVSTAGFYAQTGALFLHRDKANPVWTTFDETNLSNQLMNTQQASAGTGYGGQITIGHCLGCNNAIEGTYWALTSMTGSSSIVSPTNSIGTVFDDSFLPPFANGNPVSNYFDGAHAQSIWRKDNFQNMEVNFLSYAAINPMSRFRMAAMTGFRYFSFTDQLIYGSAADGTNFGDNGGATEAFLYSKTTNTLLGFQLGARLSYFLTPRFAVFAVPKIGLYNNHMTQNTALYTGDGIYNFNLQSSSNGLATLSEIDLGGQYYVTPRFAVFAAYRLIGVSGVALADNVLPHYLNDAPVIQTINRNGNVILQGLYTGVQWNF